MRPGRDLCIRPPLGPRASDVALIWLILTSVLVTTLESVPEVHGAQYLMVVRALRLLRMCRVFKLQRHLSAASLLGEGLRYRRTKITVFLIERLHVHPGQHSPNGGDAHGGQVRDHRGSERDHDREPQARTRAQRAHHADADAAHYKRRRAPLPETALAGSRKLDF